MEGEGAMLAIFLYSSLRETGVRLLQGLAPAGHKAWPHPEPEGLSGSEMKPSSAPRLRTSDLIPASWSLANTRSQIFPF